MMRGKRQLCRSEGDETLQELGECDLRKHRERQITSDFSEVVFSRNEQ